MKVWTANASGVWKGGDTVLPVGHLAALLKATAKLVVTLTGSSSGSATILYGATQPGVPELTPSGRTNMVRCYNSSDLASVGSGDACAYAATSFMKSGSRFPDLLGNNGAAAQTQAVNDLIGYWNGGLNDDPDQYADLFHEPDNNDSAGGLALTGANMIAAMNVVMARVAPAVNSGRRHPVKFGITFTGGFFSGGTAASIDAWIGSNWTFLGADIYLSTTTATNAAAAATRNGIGTWLEPEVGTAVGTNPTDATHLAHMQALVAKWTGMSFPPRGVTWFHNNHNLLWTTLASAASIGDTTISVHNLPGKSTSSGYAYSIANGASIKIDPHGANPETVSLTAGKSGTGGGPYTLNVPALAHAHASGTVVWLMPLSMAYWRGLS